MGEGRVCVMCGAAVPESARGVTCSLSCRSRLRESRKPAPNVADRAVAADNGCWIWQGYLNKDGYGQIKFRNKQWPAHRYSYTQSVGPIPDGLVLDHLCRTPACVNPEHLEPVTIAENVLRGIDHLHATQLAALDPPTVALRPPNPRRGITGVRNGDKTACPEGHPYDEANTVRQGRRRRCRICRTVQLREANRRLKARALLASGGAR